ncbi:MAG: NAD-dependent epimerase/dehydratase family protein [Candidatus Andersenbacteria bacterium]
MRKLLLIGGTGIIGKAAIREAYARGGYEVTTISLEYEESYPDTVVQVIADRRDRGGFQKAMVSLLNQEWDIVFDIFSFDGLDAEQTYTLFGKIAKHIVTISTALVYDRSKPTSQLITEEHSLSPRGTLGGYVDHKLELEHFWLQAGDVNWTILRPYHIIGANTLIGCLPLHNRDPNIVKRVKEGGVLELCNSGNVDLTFINPRDIAKAFFAVAGNPTTYGKAYNLVHPEIISAKNYYELLGELLGKEVVIKPKPIKEIWDEGLGWELTTLPHRYSAEALKNDTGYVASVSLRESLTEALVDYPPIEGELEEIPIHQRMNILPKPKLVNLI